MHKIVSQVTVVGGGIAGLWIAKELIDQGLSVIVVEKSSFLASGATTRNGGWLHAGTYHSIAIQDAAQAKTVVGQILSGHKSIMEFVPESVEYGSAFALVGKDDDAGEIVRKWQCFGVRYQEVPKAMVADDGWEMQKIHSVFAVDDKSVNTRIICDKLARYVVSKGGRIFTDATLRPQKGMPAHVVIGGDTYLLDSGYAVVTAGLGIKQFFEELTGRPFPVRFFKQHLLVAPRLTKNHYFSLDPSGAAVLGHGNASIVGLHRDAVGVDRPSIDADIGVEVFVRNKLVRLLPQASKLSVQDAWVAPGIKLDIMGSHDSLVGQGAFSLDFKVFEPVAGYICAVPGKMTSAPELAKAIASYLSGKEIQPAATPAGANPSDKLLLGQRRPQVNLRPLDTLLQTRPSP